MMDPIDNVFRKIEVEGAARSGMDVINQLELSLQSVLQAEPEDARTALLHEIGHLIHKLGSVTECGIDDDFVLLVVLHSDAKRYLCLATPSFFDSLSVAFASLERQGGLFTRAGAVEYINQPVGEATARLQRWDEGAKVKKLETLKLSQFWPNVEAHIWPGATAAELNFGHIAEVWKVFHVRSTFVLYAASGLNTTSKIGVAQASLATHGSA